MPICARTFMDASYSRLAAVGMLMRFFHPIDVRHLAQHDELVAVRADGAVVVEAVRELRVAADHVRRLRHRARDRVVDAARLRRLGAGHVHDLLLRVIHEAHAPTLTRWLTTARADKRAVGVEELDPVVVDDARGFRVRLADPHDRPAARQRQLQQIVGVGRVDAPFLVRRDEVEHDLGVAVRLLAEQRLDRFQIDRRLVDRRSLRRTRASTDGRHRAAGGPSACATGSVRERWCSRRCRRPLRTRCPTRSARR